MPERAPGIAFPFHQELSARSDGITPATRTHPVTQLRIDDHQKAHPGHEMREVTKKVTDQWAEWLCSCGAVFSGPSQEDEEDLLKAMTAEHDIRRHEVEAARHHQEARGHQRKARQHQRDADECKDRFEVIIKRLRGRES